MTLPPSYLKCEAACLKCEAACLVFPSGLVLLALLEDAGVEFIKRTKTKGPGVSLRE